MAEVDEHCVGEDTPRSEDPAQPDSGENALLTRIPDGCNNGCTKEDDAKALGDLPAGSYAVMSATMPHFARARTAVTLQVHGMGPFVVNYVNAADAPSAKVQ